MSMYKNIFVNEAWTEDPGSQQILGINGEVLAFGETAFSSVAEAVQAAKDRGTNAIVIKVASTMLSPWSRMARRAILPK